MKGFHAALLTVGDTSITRLLHATTPKALIQSIGTECVPQVIAIDCPRLCRVTGLQTRLAERQLHRQGIRVQWTRRSTHEPPEWMENGQ